MSESTDNNQLSPNAKAFLAFITHVLWKWPMRPATWLGGKICLAHCSHWRSLHRCSSQSRRLRSLCTEFKMICGANLSSRFGTTSKLHGKNVGVIADKSKEHNMEVGLQVMPWLDEHEKAAAPTHQRTVA